MGGREVVLFAKARAKPPVWFGNHTWSQPVRLVTSGMFVNEKDAVSATTVEDAELAVATLERAAFEVKVDPGFQTIV